MVNKYQVGGQKLGECASRFITIMSNVITVAYNIITDLSNVITVYGFKILTYQNQFCQGSALKIHNHFPIPEL